MVILVEGRCTAGGWSTYHARPFSLSERERFSLCSACCVDVDGDGCNIIVVGT